MIAGIYLTLNWRSKPKPMHRESARQTAAAQTTRKGSPCTARAPGKPQQPKRPDREARAPRERPANRSSPNDQKGKPVHRKSARQAAAAQTTRQGSPCTARAPGKPQQPKRPDREARTPQERRARTPVKENSRFSQESKKTCRQNAPQEFEKGNLVDKVVLLLMCAFSAARGLQKRPARPAATTEKSARVVLKIIMVITRFSLICVCGRRLFRRPAVVWSCCRSGGLLV